MNTRTVVVGLGPVATNHLALDWAAREARARHCPLDIVRTYSIAPALVPWDTAMDREILQDLRERAERRLDRAVAHVRLAHPLVEVHPRALVGEPYDTLVGLSREAALTVVGSRRLSALGALAMGSVSTVVAARAAGPVVVVEGPSGLAVEHPEVVVGVDGSDTTDDVLDFAFAHASRHGRALRALHCWGPDVIAQSPWLVTRDVPAKADRWLAEALAGWQEKYPDVVVHRSVVHDHPVPGLVRAAAAQELLVVGERSHHPRLASLLGSVSQGVLHRATCPVAVVHHRHGA